MEGIGDQLSIDPETVAAARAQLRAMAEGIPVAEAAVDGYTDWQVIEAIERLWTAGVSDLDEPEIPETSDAGDSAAAA
jgi:hypothetical protein